LCFVVDRDERHGRRLVRGSGSLESDTFGGGVRAQDAAEGVV
jgi:hypothetical protein